MTQHVATVEFVQTPKGAESPGSAPLGAEASYSFPASGQAFVADPEGGAGIVLRLPLWGVELTSASLSYLIATGMVAAQTNENQTTWVNFKAAANIRLGNAAGELALINRLRIATGSLLYPQPAIRISGAAKADYGALAAGDFAQGRVTYRRLWGSSTTSNVLGAMFIDTALGESVTNPATFLRRVQAAVLNGGPQILAPGSTPTAPIYVLNGGATFVANDPLGVVYIAPGDLGPGQNQLPTTLLNNTAAAYSQFPSVWLVAGAHLGAIRLVDARTEAVTVGFGQLVIRQVDRIPTFSRWQVSINGAFLEVIVGHPAGSDLRTGKAIFDAVWKPVLFGGADTQGPTIYTRTFSSTWTYRAAGYLNNTTLIRALRYVEPLDDQAADICSNVIQT